jgi:hypothetical protein
MIDVELPLDPDARLSAPRRGPRRPIGPPIRRRDALPADPNAERFGRLAGGGLRTPATAGAREDGYVDVEAQQAALLGLHLLEADEASPPAPAEADERARADTWWQQLRTNDPPTVRRQLERTFEAHGFGAAVLGVDGDVVGTALGVTSAEVLVGRWGRRPGATDLTRLTVPERHELHARMCRAAVVAMATDAVAVAPGLREVRCALLQPDHPERRPAVLALAVLPRRTLRSRDARAEVVAEGRAASEAGEEAVVQASPIGSTGALAPLDRDHPTIRRLLATLEP